MPTSKDKSKDKDSKKRGGLSSSSPSLDDDSDAAPRTQRAGSAGWSKHPKRDGDSTTTTTSSAPKEQQPQQDPEKKKSRAPKQPRGVAPTLNDLQGSRDRALEAAAAANAAAVPVPAESIAPATQAFGSWAAKGSSSKSLPAAKSSSSSLAPRSLKSPPAPRSSAKSLAKRDERKFGFGGQPFKKGQTLLMMESPLLAIDVPAAIEKAKKGDSAPLRIQTLALMEHRPTPEPPSPVVAQPHSPKASPLGGTLVLPKQALKALERNLHDASAAAAGRIDQAVSSSTPRASAQTPQAPTPIGGGDAAFEVELIENATPRMRYRDAIRLADEDVFLIMTDFAAHSSALPPTQLTRIQNVTREAVESGGTAKGVLRILNSELCDMGLQATASCAWLAIRDKIVTVACAGAERPFVLRNRGERVVRVQASDSVELGRMRSAKFAERALHFDQGDTLLLPSAVWVDMLEKVFADEQASGLDKNTPLSEWFRRQQATHPVGGALLCLSLRK